MPPLSHQHRQRQHRCRQHTATEQRDTQKAAKAERGVEPRPEARGPRRKALPRARSPRTKRRRRWQREKWQRRQQYGSSNISGTGTDTDSTQQTGTEKERETGRQKAAKAERGVEPRPEARGPRRKALPRARSPRPQPRRRRRWQREKWQRRQQYGSSNISGAGTEKERQTGRQKAAKAERGVEPRPEARGHRRGALRRAPSARPWRHGSHALLLDADSEWSTSRRFAERALYAHVAPQSAHNQSFETWPQSAQNSNIARDAYLCTVGPQKLQVFSAKVQIMHLWLITQRS